MKRFLPFFLLLAALFVQEQMFAQKDSTRVCGEQTTEKQITPFDIWMRSNWGFSMGVGSNLYYGDLNAFDVLPTSLNHKDNNTAFSFGLNKQLNDYIIWKGNFIHGELSGIKEEFADGSLANMYFYAKVTEYSTTLKFNVSNILLGAHDRKLSLYSYVGAGIIDFRTIRKDLTTNKAIQAYGYNGSTIFPTNTTREVVFPLGIGLDWKISKPISLYVDFSLRIANTDKLDSYISNSNNRAIQDMYGFTSIGFSYTFGMRDCDHDGVVNKLDKCPETPYGLPVNVEGCISDTDGDGIIDTEDKCPTVIGTIPTKGCPDSDGDGIADAEDACPLDKGLVEFQGCPDSDSDGIADKQDKCPKEKGLKEFDGCPDFDSDGIADWEDRCPKFAGSKEFNGCPDKDKDGIVDIDDKCPDVAGVAKNLGCPEVKKEVLKIFEKALTGIQFETGKDVIKPVSYPILDLVVKAMKENPTYNLAINGHTDNVGDPIKNMDLSKKRAESVKNYLANKGIEDSRMVNNGYGDTMPIADNKTTAGKAKNRRVEFKVLFEIVEIITE